MESLVILFLAIGFDLILGEPPSVVHPVVWLGKLISSLERLSPSLGSMKQFVFGLLSLILSVILFTGLTALVLFLAGSFSSLAYIIIGALLLKSTFAIKMLFKAAHEVAGPLRKGDLVAAQVNLRSLVSRDTSQLGEPLIAAAAVESVAENSADSFVAPIFYFALFGVPGAMAYRAINTFDSMWGYHGKYEYLGKAAARIDDVVNFVPARLAGLFLILVATFTGNGSRAWNAMSRYHGETESPNAGWTMSAMAGALGVRLEKVGHYRLGDSSESLSVGKIDEAVRLVQGSILLSVLFAAAVLIVASKVLLP